MRYTLAIVLALFIVHGPKAWAARATETLQPNVIIILADDLGYGDIGCYGSEVNQTPHLDRLATEGMRFTDFHSNGPMCTPTRVALLTGLYQNRFGRMFEGALSGKTAYDDGLPLDAVTIAETLKKAGYATGMYGKWHLGYHPPLMPTRQGFDDYRGLVGGGGDHFSHIDRSGREDWWHNEEIAMETGYSAELITKHGVAFIERHRDDPFFLYLPHQVIHFPWQGPNNQGYRAKGGDYWDDKHGRIEDRSDVSPYVKAMVESLDQSVGRIMATLDRLDLNRRTLVFFASDNGGYLRYGGGYENISSNGPLRGQKGNMYEGGHRVPAIAWWPGKIRPGTVTHETTATFDLFPTLLHVAGLGNKVAELNLDGEDIAPLLLDSAAVAKRTLFWRMRGAKAVRRGPWKLVVRGKGTPQLYNLDNDISEEHDLAAVRTDVVNQLETELSAWEADVDTKSVSGNMGKTWTYQRSEFPPIGGGQRLVLMRLSEGPILLVSFTDSRRRAGMTFTDAGGREFTGYGMFAALSFDEGKTWPVKKLLTAGGPQREVDGGGNTHEFIMDDTHAEPAGYLASTQTPDGVIHLISSRWHYRFNLAWLKTPNQSPAER